MKYTKASYIQSVLHENGFSPLKQFGQNFLIDDNIVKQICDVSDIENKNIVEIGPGLGGLTSYMIKSAKKVVAIEIDNGFYAHLTKEFSDQENLKIINNDVLEIDIKTCCETEFGDEEFILVANLPYYITTACIMKFLTANINIKRMVVMMQKEVARRLCAEAGSKEYGSLSAIISYFGDASSKITVSGNCFYPMPDVDSCVVKLEIKNKPSKESQIYIDFVRSCFKMKRKTLFNNLKQAGYPKEMILDAFISANIDEKIRAEKLCDKNFKDLIKALT